jgi:hypothetical protein
MSLLVWATIGLLLGPTTVALLPVLLAWVGGPELRERVGAIYIDRMVNVLGPAAIVAKEQGGLALSQVGTAPKFDADTLVVDGERGHLKDTMGVKDYLKSKPFGIALDSAPAYVSPLLAEFAEAATDARDDGRVGVQPDGGVRLDFEVPELPQVPDLRQAWRILEGATGFRDGVVAEDWTRKSQEKFHERIGLSQTIMLIAAFGVGVGLAFLIGKYGGDTGGTTIPVLAPLALPWGGDDDDPGRVRAWVARQPWRMYGTIAGTVVLGGAFVATAAVVDGALAAAAFLGAGLLGASIPVAVLWGLKDATPGSGLVATGLAMLAQITYGDSALIRTDTGRYEWRLLREDADGLFAQLTDGTTVPIDTNRDNLYRFALGGLAITEQKTHTNMREFATPDVSGAADESTRERRGGYPVHHPAARDSDSWLVSLANIQPVTSRSGEPDIVARGRDKALEEAGGTQQISAVITMALAAGLLVVGFVLGFGAMSL